MSNTHVLSSTVRLPFTLTQSTPWGGTTCRSRAAVVQVWSGVVFLYRLLSFPRQLRTKRTPCVLWAQVALSSRISWGGGRMHAIYVLHTALLRLESKKTKNRLTSRVVVAGTAHLLPPAVGPSASPHRPSPPPLFPSPSPVLESTCSSTSAASLARSSTSTSASSSNSNSACGCSSTRKKWERMYVCSMYVCMYVCMYNHLRFSSSTKHKRERQAIAFSCS